MQYHTHFRSTAEREGDRSNPLHIVQCKRNQLLLRTERTRMNRITFDGNVQVMVNNFALSAKYSTKNSPQAV